jgi:hypothetical protein
MKLCDFLGVENKEYLQDYSLRKGKLTLFLSSAYFFPFFGCLDVVTHPGYPLSGYFCL